ncbi:MAG: UPF0149 family protein [Gammaproteobacteria bacterium]|nr:UPF0149 family protein [Gammaproteobacteria bacterium]
MSITRDVGGAGSTSEDQQGSPETAQANTPEAKTGEVAELGGALCGLLCAHAISAENPLAAMAPMLGGRIATGSNAAEILDAPSDAEPGSEPKVESGVEPGVAAFLAALPENTRALMGEFSDGTFEIERVLPVDGLPIRLRAEAFVAWCAGFLVGIGLAGERRLSSLSEEAREVLSDLSEFTRMSLLIQPSDEAESDLMELIEYVRVGAMLLYEELAPPPVPTSSAVH